MHLLPAGMENFRLAGSGRQQMNGLRAGTAGIFFQQTNQLQCLFVCKHSGVFCGAFLRTTIWWNAVLLSAPVRTAKSTICFVGQHERRRELGDSPLF